MKYQIQGIVKTVGSEAEGRILCRYIRISPRPSLFFVREISTIGHWISECVQDEEHEGKTVVITIEME